MESSRTARWPTLAKIASRNLREHHHQDAAHAIGEDHEQRHRDERRRPPFAVEAHRRVFVGKGRQHRHDLGEDQQQRSPPTTRSLRSSAPVRPEIGQRLRSVCQ